MTASPTSRGAEAGEWVLVPRELTEQMRKTLHGSVVIRCYIDKREASIMNDQKWWEAVLAASPPAPVTGTEGVVPASLAPDLGGGEKQGASPSGSGSHPSRGPLLAKAREQFAYWQERVRRQKHFEECWNEDGTEYAPLGDDDAHELGYCKGRWAEAEWWLKTIEALPAPSHEEIIAEMTRNIEAAHAELSRVFPPDDRSLCECRIGQCRALTERCREPEA